MGLFDKIKKLLGKEEKKADSEKISSDFESNKSFESPSAVASVTHETLRWQDECKPIGDDEVFRDRYKGSSGECMLGHYKGSERKVIIPAYSNGKKVVAIWSTLNPSWDDIQNVDVSLESVIIPKTVQVIDAAFFNNVRKVYFEEGSELKEIPSLTGRCFNICLEEANFPNGVDLSGLFAKGVVMPNATLFTNTPRDDQGILTYRDCHINGSRALDVYDTRDAKSISLNWVTADKSVGKIIIRSNVESISLPSNTDYLGDFEVVDNKEYFIDNGVLCLKREEKKRMLYINKSRSDKLLVVDDKAIVEIPKINNPHIETVIIEPHIFVCDEAFDLQHIRTVVSKNKDTVLRTVNFLNYENGMTLYAEDGAIIILDENEKICRKPLSSYGKESVPYSLGLESETKATSVKAAPQNNYAAKSTTPNIVVDKSLLARSSEPRSCTNDKYDAKTLNSLNRIFDRIEAIYPEHKIFAFSSLMDDARESLAKIAKANGLSGYEEILNDFGYQVISKEKVHELRPTVIYKPGKEPECIKSRVENALKLLAEYYPDKVIEKPIDKEHKSLGGKITGLYQWLGYASLRGFITAYGYEYRVKELGKTDDVDEIVGNLKKKYSDAKKVTTLTQLYDENPEIVRQLKRLYTKSTKLFGMDFGTYLVSIGVMVDKEQEQRDAFEKVVANQKSLSAIYRDIGLIERKKASSMKEDQNDIKGKNCCVLVGFGNKEYKYNSPIRVHVGDLVSVSGKMKEYTGDVVRIIGPWDDSPYMQKITKVLLAADTSNDSEGVWIPFDVELNETIEQHAEDLYDLAGYTIDLRGKKEITIYEEVILSNMTDGGTWDSDNFSKELTFLGDFREYLESDNCDIFVAKNFSVVERGIYTFESGLDKKMEYMKISGTLEICGKEYLTNIIFIYDAYDPIVHLDGVYFVPQLDPCYDQVEEYELNAEFRFNLDTTKVHVYDPDKDDVHPLDDNEDNFYGTYDQLAASIYDLFGNKEV